MPVHLYGRPCEMEVIREIANNYGLKIIEDNAQAIGAFVGAERTGHLGDAAAFSFYPTKNLGALGDAGAVTTDDAALADTVRALGNAHDRQHARHIDAIHVRQSHNQGASQAYLRFYFGI